MAEWKAPFKQGVSSFRVGKHQDAIASFSEALRHGGDPATVCDARAAVYQKLGKLKEALTDAKVVIDSQPGRWQGYARSARLFYQIRKFDAALRMVDLALERIPLELASRRDEILVLQREVESSREQVMKEAAQLASIRAYHFGRLPIEIATTMFSLVLAEQPAYVVILAQVCKNWRFAVLCTPAFWSSLVVKENHHPARKIKVWKERSKNKIRELALTNDFSQTPSVLEELGKLSLRSLATLRLENFPIRQLRAHLPSISDQCLQVLRGWHDGNAASLVGVLRWDDKTPRFSPRTIDITSNIGLSIDWAQLSDSLTDLQSCCFKGSLGHDWHHVMWLLHRNPNLADLEICHWLPPHANPPPDREVPPIVTMSKLSTFKILASVPERLLSVLSSPSLKSLDISHCRGTLNGALQHLADGRAAMLTSLAIRSAAFDPHFMVRALATMPSLELLQLSAIGGDAVKIVLEALAHLQPSLLNNAATLQRTHECVYCPSLRTLDCSQNQTVRGGELVRLVKLRITKAEKGSAGDEARLMQAGAMCVQPLQALIVDGCPMLDPEVLPWLREKVPSVSCIYMTKKAAGWKR